MLKMVLPDNIDLELYVATNKFRDRRQYEESQKVLNLIDQFGVRDKVDITHLDNLIGKEHIFIMTDKGRERRLPYLEYTHLGTGIYSYYMGLVEIIEMFEGLGLHQENGDKTQN